MDKQIHTNWQTHINEHPFYKQFYTWSPHLFYTYYVYNKEGNFVAEVLNLNSVEYIGSDLTSERAKTQCKNHFKNIGETNNG